MRDEEYAFVRPCAFEAGNVFFEEPECDSFPPMRGRDADGVDADRRRSRDVRGHRFMGERFVRRERRADVADELAAGPLWSVCA